MSLRTSRRQAFNCLVKPSPQWRLRRCYSSVMSEESSEVEEKVETVLSKRWLADLKSRIGKCISFGLKPDQVKRAGNILQVAAREWKDLLAGREGFLTGPGRAGLDGHRVVWGEMDSMQHLNNVTYTRYAESARINWAWNYAVHIDPEHSKQWSELWTPRGDGLILRSIRTDYKFPMTWPDRVSIYHKLRSAPISGTDSLKLDVMILSEKHQRVSARCVEDIVVYDYRKGKKQPLPEFMAKAFTQTFRLQEDAKSNYTKRVSELLRRVESLEKESWDRRGAKEDFGSDR